MVKQHSKGFLKVVRDIDLFGAPVQLAFQDQMGIIKTLFGGIWSIFIFMILIALYVSQFKILFSYGRNYVNEVKSSYDLDELGLISLQEMNTVPFYSFKFKGKILKLNNELCDGNCFDFIDQFVNLYFV